MKSEDISLDDSFSDNQAITLIEKEIGFDNKIS